VNSDFAILGSGTSPYRVTVVAGPTFTLGDIEFGGNASTGASLSIDGSMTTGVIQYSTTGPANSVTVDPGGLLEVGALFGRTDVQETITIAGTGTGVAWISPTP